MDHLRILGLEVFGHHGVTLEEQAVGRPFSIDVEMTCDLREAGRRDDLNVMVDYGALCRLVAESMRLVPTVFWRRLQKA